MTRVLVIDNYDSFTYNLVQYLGELGAELEVFRNDAIDGRDSRALAPDRIVVSPGPRTPAEAGISWTRSAASRGALPVLGVCLGHQAIGAGVRRQRRARPAPCTARPAPDQHDGRAIFAGLEPVRGGPLPLARGGPARCPTASRSRADGRRRDDGRSATASFQRRACSSILSRC